MPSTLVKYPRLIDNFGYQSPKNPREMELYDAFKEEYAHSLKFQILPDIDKSYVLGHFNQNYYDGVKVGSGYGDVISTALATIKAGTDLYNVYGSERATQLKNLYGKYLNPHHNWRPSYAGERHLLDPYSGAMMNYCGPGTHLRERQARGDLPLDYPGGLDEQCMKHDIAYAEAQNFGQIRFADKKFIADVEQSTAKPILKSIAKMAIKGKMKAEDIGLLSKSRFLSPQNLIQQTPAHLGSGDGDPMESLRKKTYRKTKKQRIDSKLTKALKQALS